MPIVILIGEDTTFDADMVVKKIATVRLRSCGGQLRRQRTCAGTSLCAESI
jgi:hypothetical protein